MRGRRRALGSSTSSPTLIASNAERSRNPMGGAAVCHDLRVVITNVAVSGRATEREFKSVGAVFEPRKGIETRG